MKFSATIVSRKTKKYFEKLKKIHYKYNFTLKLSMSMDLKSAIKSAVERYIDLQGTQFSQNIYHDILGLTEQHLIKTVLQKTDNNRSQAAKILGISRVTLIKKLKDL